jgi:dihydroorotase
MHKNKIKSSIQTKIVIRGIDVWNADSERNQVDVLVQNGIVESISEHLSKSYPSDAHLIDGKGLVLMPAGVDAQVHLRVPGQPHKETASSGLWAAVAGGVGALLTMPNTNPVLDRVSVLELARREIKEPAAETGVQVLFSAAMTIGQKGRECVDFEALARAGVSAFTDDGVGVADDQMMENVFRGAARTGLPLLQHAEVPGHGGVLAAGPVQSRLGGVAYPEAAEFDMVKRDLDLLNKVPEARYHVLHVSSAKTIDLVKKARQAGLSVSCEVSPHHLFFTAEDIDRENSSFKMNPPIRSAEDRARLQSALENGDCDFMATDHAPHEAAVKTVNFKTSAFGTTGLETSLRVLIWLWQQGKLPSSRLVQTWATNPARFLGVANQFGNIAEGRPFNAVICDVRATDRLVLASDFVGLSSNSCFVNARLPGRVVATILGSNVHVVS